MSENRAMKLLEAFSEVDEELLERCENASVANSVKKSGDEKVILFRRPLYKWASACAAVLCLIVVGAVGWNALRVGYDNVSNETAMDPGVTFATASGQKKIDVETDYTAMADKDTEALKESEESGGTNADDGEVLSGVVIDDSEDLFVASGKSEGAIMNEQEKVSDSGSMGGQNVLTEEEARQFNVLGAYVPTVLPEGYVFESAYSMEGEDGVVLSLGWSRGLDYIKINIKVVQSLPEMADESVCVWEEFDLTYAMDMLIAGVNDNGDTDTPRGHFAVLYPEGVLVEFNGRGTAEEIWEMFTLIPGNEN